ncbi:MAG: LLM class oxidoreductase [Proteobacteria bacterium]|nr:LLM class oxidoreductase [Pseudomonadota bacterium]
MVHTPVLDEPLGFERINRGYDSVFQLGRLTIGLVVPIENYSQGPVPAMTRHLERARLAEDLGFSALWLRDVPFNVPSFGDAGQVFDPWVYLGLLAGQTKRIALGVASIVLPLRHPVHVAKAAASVDVLSGGRLILGVASGDRPDEYPAMAARFDDRGQRFRASFDYIRHVGREPSPFDNPYGRLHGRMDILPKPSSGRIPLLITGGSQQSPDWVARHGDGWMVYPDAPASQARRVQDYRGRTAAADRGPMPVMQPLYVDLQADPDATPQPIHLGLRTGSRHLLATLRSLEASGVNHVALNLRHNSADIETTLQRLAAAILPAFTA